MEKKCYFKTAKASISCAHFSAGEFVAVKYSYTDGNGTDWYDIDRSERGALPYKICYPQHHLTEFCL
jgi:hypothetical protein